MGFTARLDQVIGRFLEAGVRDGSMRDEVSARDITLTLAGAVYLATTVDDPQQVARVMDLITAGLRRPPT